MPYSSARLCSTPWPSGVTASPWNAVQNGRESRFIELAGSVGAGMPHHVVERVAEPLNGRSDAVRGSRATRSA